MSAIATAMRIGTGTTGGRPPAGGACGPPGGLPAGGGGGPPAAFSLAPHTLDNDPIDYSTHDSLKPFNKALEGLTT